MKITASNSLEIVLTSRILAISSPIELQALIRDELGADPSLATNLILAREHAKELRRIAGAIESRETELLVGTLNMRCADKFRPSL